MSESSGSVTRILARLERGEQGAIDELISMVYGELRALASQQRRRVPSAQLLNTTALVHEVYERLAKQESLSFKDRQHFFAVCATAMRQLLLNEAQRRQTIKRGGAVVHVDADDGLGEGLIQEDKVELILQVHQGLDELARHDKRLVEVVEYRFFLGLTHEEIATLTGSSEATVKRQWRRARAWLLTLFEEGTNVELPL